jgi:hypothetical protein
MDAVQSKESRENSPILGSKFDLFRLIGSDSILAGGAERNRYCLGGLRGGRHVAAAIENAAPL